MNNKQRNKITPEVQQRLNQIGVMVRKHRKRMCKNYEDFAIKYDFNKVTLQRIETGKNYTMSSFIQLLNILDVSKEDFFDEAEVL